ncbi:SAP30-binding protein [Orchesella cincta]|uniref:SAP30-binding protein n=1 Tax=Orchesella cincta TaxID=48709 RepID=A0A1D2NAK2_ORCCI|nr:SAP30-binding protein [Orchesella cincta]
MSSSAHSALASLTANYTDSEPEEDDVEQEDPVPTVEKDDDNDMSAGKEDSGARSVSPIDDSNSRDDAHSVSSAGDSTSGGSRSKANNPLGLVSYQDDLIDDDAVDDFDHNSDSMQDNENTAGEEVDSSSTLETAAAVKGDTSGLDDIVDLEDISQDKEIIDENETVQTSVKKVKLPPEAPGKCSQELQDKFARLLERKMIKGLNMNAHIQCNKQFRNPSIYEKLIIRCNIDELGTNYPKDIYDPHIWDESSYYDEIAKAQKTEMERREKERKERTKVEFVSGTVKKNIASGSAPGAPSEGETKRKSKWDQKGVMPVFATAVSAPTVQPVIVQPPFTTSSSGTKGTVISAFGSLPKKPKN